MCPDPEPPDGRSSLPQSEGAVVLPDAGRPDRLSVADALEVEARVTVIIEPECICRTRAVLDVSGEGVEPFPELAGNTRLSHEAAGRSWSMSQARRSEREQGLQARPTVGPSSLRNGVSTRPRRRVRRAGGRRGRPVRRRKGGWPRRTPVRAASSSVSGKEERQRTERTPCRAQIAHPTAPPAERSPGDLSRGPCGRRRGWSVGPGPAAAARCRGRTARRR